MQPSSPASGLFSSILVRLLPIYLLILLTPRTTGGPGESPMGLLNGTDLSDYFMSFTGGHYDFVAWDPRGVGLST